MNSIFYKLLDNTLAEVCRREPAYTSFFPINVSYEGMVSAYAQHPLCNQLPAGAVEQSLAEGLTYVAKEWARAKEASTATDPIAQFLCDSIIDAFCADQGLVALQPHTGTKQSMADVLTQQFSKRQTPQGVSYYVRNGGVRPLLVINATGAPIAVWNQFFADTTHDFKIILPQRRGSHLFRGGLQQHVDIKTDSADLSSILDAESFEQADILAWCNGGRVAIDLANSRVHQISSMVLLAPMLKGIQGMAASPSNFERDLQPLLDVVSKEASMAPFVAGIIAKQPASPDWKRWLNAPTSRAHALFAMPAKDHFDAMTAMLTDPQSFINIARRVASDESYPMNQALGNLKTRTMVIQGSDDNIVSNDLVSSAMKQMCHTSISHVVLRGGGHYIHDLQYHYLRWLLTQFLEKHQIPQVTARIQVQALGSFMNGEGRG
jgi:pimeloyl-ACP methyl ester carboxylesterase